MHARRFNRPLLAQPVLRRIEQLAALRHVGFLHQHRGDSGVDVLKFVGDDVRQLRQLAGRLHIVISAPYLLISDLPARRVRRRVQRDEPIAHVLPARAIIRPSWPPPSTPIVAPGRMRGALLSVSLSHSLYSLRSASRPLHS